MRIVICALSAVLLSGCSWLGGINKVFAGQSTQGAHGQQAGQYGHAGAVKYGQNARAGQAQQYGQNSHGQNSHGQNFGGGFPQQPQYGAPQQVTGAYGTHAGNAHQAQNSQRSKPQMRKPRLRGSLSLGLEKSVSGDALDYNQNIALPFSLDFVDANGDFSYNQPTGFSGTPSDDLTISSDLTATQTSINAPSISFDDIHSTPMRIAGGLEFIMTPKTTVFANAGFTSAEGNEGGAVNIIGDVEGSVTYAGYRNNVFSGSNVVERALRNAPISQFSYDFSDLERYDLEVGGRYYFNPILRSSSKRSITPFMGASVGAAHYNEITYKTQAELLELHDFVLNDEVRFGPVFNTNAPTVLQEAQWVPTGQLNAGLEWQATPKTAIAFETGIKFEGARDYAPNAAGDSEKGDTNIAVPFTIRGSYNF